MEQRQVSSIVSSSQCPSLPLVSVDTLHIVTNELSPMSAINNQNANVRWVTDQRKRKALCALDCAPYETHKNKNPKAVLRTCRWFTEHEKFQRWIDNKENTPLLVTADPGCGKSVLARYMIDNDEVLNASRVIYFFFKDGSKDQSSALSAVRCLIHQLLKDNSTLFEDEVLQSLEELGHARSKGFSDLWKIFIKIACHPEAAGTICVLDALDECETTGWSRMAEALGDLVRSHNPDLRFILLSRSYDQIRIIIRECDIQCINLCGEGEAELDKISAEIDVVITKEFDNMVSSSKINIVERGMVIRRLKSANNRTYLWIRLVCDMLKDYHRVQADSLESLLNNLPKTADGVYDSILRRSTDIQMATKLLHIIVAATRPLKVKEMAVAMAVNSHKTLDYDYTVMETDAFEQSMRGICGLFVVVIQEKVCLIHQSAREFLIESGVSGHSLKWKGCLSPTESNRILASICIQYLVNIGDQCASLPDDEWLERWENFPLFQDAATSWVLHYHESSINKSPELRCELTCLCDATWKGCIVWYYLWRAFNNNDNVWPSKAVAKILALSLADEPYSSFTSLGLALFLGIECVVDTQLTRENFKVFANDASRLSTALILAVKRGHHGIVVRFLETRHPLFSGRYRAIDFGKLLKMASEEGHGAVAKTLLNTAKAKINRDDVIFALSRAATNGHESVVRLLLLARVGGYRARLQSYQRRWLGLGSHRPRHRDPRDRRAPLSRAAEQGHLTVVETLLNSGQVDRDLASDSVFSQTPLSYAAKMGHMDVVELLLTTGEVNINHHDYVGATPISLAARCGNLRMVKLLHEKWKASLHVTKTDISRGSPVIGAIEGKLSGSVLSYLIDTADMDCNFEYAWESSGGRISHSTLLRRAAESSSPQILTALLGRKANVNLRSGKDGETALSWAVRRGRPAAVQVLLEAEEVDLSMRYKNDLSLCQIARESADVAYVQDPDYEKVVKLLDTHIHSLPDGGGATGALERSILRRNEEVGQKKQVHTNLGSEDLGVESAESHTSDTSSLWLSSESSIGSPQSRLPFWNLIGRFKQKRALFPGYHVE